MMLTPSKRPRQYAYAIMQMKTREERQKALDKVPEEYKDWVVTLVTNAFAIRSAK